MLDAALVRHATAPAAERRPALVYLAELLARTGDLDRAVAVLDEADDLVGPHPDEHQATELRQTIAAER